VLDLLAISGGSSWISAWRRTPLLHQVVSSPVGAEVAALRGQRPSAVKLDLIAFGDLSFGAVCQI
jgi:hypothetical protein